MEEILGKDSHHPEKWRPQDTIRAKVIGIARKENRILVCEVLNDHGVLKGWCPLGGGVEFGEMSENALKREISEELGCNIVISGEPMVFESIFEHHGYKGHEIIFAFQISLDAAQIYAKERFQIYESNGRTHWVQWVPIEKFQSGEAILFPNALLNRIL